MFILYHLARPPPYFLRWALSFQPGTLQLAISLAHMSELFKSLLCWNILSARYAVWHVFVFPYHGCLKLGIGSQAQGEAVMSTALRAWLWPHCSDSESQ